MFKDLEAEVFLLFSSWNLKQGLLNILLPMSTIQKYHSYISCAGPWILWYPSKDCYVLFA